MRISRCALTAVIVAIGVWAVSAQSPASLRTADGVLEFVANTSDGTVTITDRLNHSTLSRSLVCPEPTLGALTPDEVAVLILCSSEELVFVNTAAFDVTGRVTLSARPVTVTTTADGGHAEVFGAGGVRLAMVDLARQRAVDRVETRVPRPDAARRNDVLFLGMIHGEHRTSTRFGLNVVRQLVEAIDPDYWLTEIAPNRMARAVEEFARTGTVAEPRVARFPEYVNVLFPLSRRMHFTAYGTAG